MVKPETKVTLMEQRDAILIEQPLLVATAEQVDLQHQKTLVNLFEVTIKE